MEQITIEQVLAWEPCEDYDEGQLIELYPSGVATPLEIADDDRIPIEDRIWLLCHVYPETRWHWADRARLAAAWGLAAVGLETHAASLRDLPPVRDEATARATAWAAAWAVWDALDAARAARATEDTYQLAYLRVLAATTTGEG